jgi:hypothetical protein
VVNRANGHIDSDQLVVHKLRREGPDPLFAGYNTRQPSSNLADYRTIGRFQVQFPAGYLAPRPYSDE